MSNGTHVYLNGQKVGRCAAGWLARSGPRACCRHCWYFRRCGPGGDAEQAAAAVGAALRTPAGGGGERGPDCCH
eukprot:1150417-Pelagomonas_calceolata.AAC.1